MTDWQLIETAPGMVGYELVVAFPDDSPSFCYGFEAGGLWERMKRGDVAEIEVTTRNENHEVIARMGVALGWTVAVKPSEVDGWDYTTLTKVAPAPERANPHGLRIIAALSSGRRDTPEPLR